jgi:hypothetical protein
MDNNFEKGDLIEFRWTNKGKWYTGRISEIEPQQGWKAIYKIEAFKKGTKLNWPEILKMCDGKESGDMFIRNVKDWYFVKWFSKDYIRKYATS